MREQVAQRVAPEKVSMSKADWEAKDKKKSSEMLLQVAFKAAVELAVASKTSGALLEHSTIEKETLAFHTWLLSQTEGQIKNKLTNIPANMVPPGVERITAPSDNYDVPLPELEF